MKKLLEQFDLDSEITKGHKKEVQLNEEQATLLYIIDTLNKHLFEIEKQPIRKVRKQLDDFAKGLMYPDLEDTELLFKLRQFYSTYRIDEYSYIQNTFDDFKRIIWDFADQLADDIRVEKTKDEEVSTSLEHLREAVESNSIDDLRVKSHEFISFYKEYQTQKDERRTKRLGQIRKNLNTVKKQLVEANHNMRLDHLTEAHNRKSFDEQLKKYISLYQIEKTPVSLITLDIDHFKKINDSYGHDIGDFVLKECVRLLKEVFNGNEDFVSRIGGEEFSVILPGQNVLHATHKAEEAMRKIRAEAFVQDDLEIRFTVSMGIAQLSENETADQWLKRADQALYQSKNTGRNKITVADHPQKTSAA